MRNAPLPMPCLRGCDSNRPTIFGGVPTLYASMLSTALPARAELQIAHLHIAGEALPRDIGERWTRPISAWIFLDGHRLDEMLHLFRPTAQRGVLRHDRSGRYPVDELRLVDDDGRPARPRQIGELQIAGTDVRPGMVLRDNRERTRQTFQGP